MIEQAESGLSSGDYNALAGLQTGATFKMTLQRLNLSFSLLTGSSSTLPFDACVCTDHLIRATWTASNYLNIFRFNPTYGTWSDVTPAGPPSTTIPPALWGSGSTAQVVYGLGTTIYFRQSTNSGATWSAYETVGTLTGLLFVAPVASREFYAVAWTSNYLTIRRYYYTSSWQSVASNHYLPKQPASFDAERITGGDYDVLALEMEGATRYGASRQGIFTLFVRKDRYSHLFDAEVVDEVSHAAGTPSYREDVKLATVNGLLWMTYLSGSEGPAYFINWSVSETGRFWEMRQPVDANFEAKVCLLGSYVYLVGAGYLYRSDSTVLTGGSAGQIVVTGDVASYTANRSTMHQSSIQMHNEDGGLTSLLAANARYQIKEEVGYWSSGGSQLVQQIALSEVDVVERARVGPKDMVTLSCRDRLSWMADRTEAEEFQEWPSPLRHVDEFESLGHTAVIGNSTWAIVSDILLCQTNLADSFALCTVSGGISKPSNPWFHAYIRTTTSGKVGLFFRSDSDCQDLWCAYYDHSANRIYLRQRVAGVWQSTVANSGTLGWSADTWYKILIECKGKKIRVYYSTTGASAWASNLWTLAFEYIDVASSSLVEGYCGYYANATSNGSTTGAQIDNVFLTEDDNYSMTIEEVIRCLGEYAGIHSFKFDDFDFDWDVGGAGGSWSVNGDWAQGTGGGSAQWYWMWSNASTENAFVLTTKKSGARGAIAFYYGESGGSWYRYFYWNSTQVGVIYQNPITGTTTMATVPRTFTGNGEEIRLSCQRDIEGYAFVTVWVDGQLAISCYLAVNDPIGFKVGLGVYQSDTVTFDALRIAELTEEIPILTMDVGETPMSAMQRALGRRRIAIGARFNGALSAHRVKAQTNKATFDGGDAYTYQEARDNRARFSHYRQVGAWDAADAYDTAALGLVGHKYHKDDNPDLLYKEDAQNEAEFSLARTEEEGHKGTVEMPFLVFLEPGDRISVYSTDWMIVSDSIKLQAGALIQTAQLQGYVYG